MTVATLPESVAYSQRCVCDCPADNHSRPGWTGTRWAVHCLTCGCQYEVANADATNTKNGRGRRSAPYRRNH